MNIALSFYNNDPPYYTDLKILDLTDGTTVTGSVPFYKDSNTNITYTSLKVPFGSTQEFCFRKSNSNTAFDATCTYKFLSPTEWVSIWIPNKPIGKSYYYTQLILIYFRYVYCRKRSSH